MIITVTLRLEPLYDQLYALRESQLGYAPYRRMSARALGEGTPISSS